MLGKQDILTGRRLVFYTDAKGFGGHDIQSLHALKCFLRQGAHVACFYRESTQLWEEALKKLQADYAITLHPLKLPNVRFHRPYHFFNPGLTRKLGLRMQKEKPDAVFLSQGNLEISAIGSLAARRAGIPSISYIALAHSFRELGANRASRRDRFNRYLATVPTRWLTISESMRERLRARGAQQAIDLLPNLVERPRVVSRTQARRELGLPEDALVLGMTGRIEPKQKGTDTFWQALDGLPREHPLRDAWIFILGEGAGRVQLLKKLETSGWSGRIKWQAWCEDPWQYYPAYDLLAAPSYFEGLPIAVQENILCGVPIAATHVDGLGEYLPSEWTCQPGEPAALRALMENFQQDPERYRAPLSALIETTRQKYNREAFEAALLKSLASLWGEKGIAQSTRTPDS